MNLPGSLILALVLQAYHLGELLGQGIANDTDDTNGSTGDHRESEGIVAADDIKGGRLVLDNLVHLFQTAAGFLDGHNVLAVAGQTHRGFCLEVDSRAPGYII